MSENNTTKLVIKYMQKQCCPVFKVLQKTTLKRVQKDKILLLAGMLVTITTVKASLYRDLIKCQPQ